MQQTWSSCGAMSWHGPHHTAKTSRRMGVEQSWSSCSNSAVVTCEREHMGSCRTPQASHAQQDAGAFTPCELRP